MIIILLIIIVVILVLLIINQAVNNFADTKMSVKLSKFKVEPYNLEDLQVEKIGICYSITTYLPYEIYTLGHQDILCYCSDRNWYMIAEIYDKNDILGKQQHVLGIRKVEPKKTKLGLVFKHNGYKYSCFKLFKPDCYVNLKFVFNTFVDNFAIPYHILKNNCHHLCRCVINVTTNRKTLKTVVSEFETIKYINKVIYEIMNDKYGED